MTNEDITNSNPWWSALLTKGMNGFKVVNVFMPEPYCLNEAKDTDGVPHVIIIGYREDGRSWVVAAVNRDTVKRGFWEWSNGNYDIRTYAQALIKAADRFRYL